MLFIAGFVVLTHTHNNVNARYYQVRVGGCTGTKRRDYPICRDCAICPVGEYVTGNCTADSVNMSSECKACLPCSIGTYLARFVVLVFIDVA